MQISICDSQEGLAYIRVTRGCVDTYVKQGCHVRSQVLLGVICVVIPMLS